MKKEQYETYVRILEEELVPAMGCTEPIALAYASALASSILEGLPVRVLVQVSGNMIKNAKSAIVPHTDGRKGIPSAIVAGIVAGCPEKKLEVLSGLSSGDIEKIGTFLETIPIIVEKVDSPHVLDIRVQMENKEHSSFVWIAGGHTNVVMMKRDNEICARKECSASGDESSEYYDFLTVERIVEFADNVNVRDVRKVLKRQIDNNMAIAEEGLRRKLGANIGNILLDSYGDTIHNRAKAYAAAGSDARMSGCEMPVVINSGSGNQGLTASLPVVVYARGLGVSEEVLYRALCVSNLVTIHLKSGIGKLSAYCGATSAGAGAGAGITYLYGGKYNEIAHTIVNALAINSGMVCDGAKASCAAKIASAVEAGLLGMQMDFHNSEFVDGEGIIVKGVENTICNINRLAKEGMHGTDETILDLMVRMGGQL